MKFSLTLVLGFLLAPSCANMTAEQKHRCEEYTSIFENDTTDLQYGYCEHIHDGRGFTAGRAGFCTGTGDAIKVIKKYTAHKSNNPLKKFIPELEHLAKHKSGNISRLPGYCTAWHEAAKDAKFRECQDEVSDNMYYHPAMHEAHQIGVMTPLGRCAFYDTIIQHGGGDDPDSLHAIVCRTMKAMNGKVNHNEHYWILKFLEVRKHVLFNPHNKSTKKVWRKSVDRVDAMIDLAHKNNWYMKPPMHIKTKNHDKIIY